MPESLRVAVAEDAEVQKTPASSGLASLAVSPAALHVRHFAGVSSRRPFVLVHGLSSNARLWDGVAGRLAAHGHPVYAVDLRSHGESDRPAEGYDTATAAADLDAV